MSCRIISVLLISQAFCAVTGSPSSLVRKKINAQVAVMPDGEIQTVGAPSLKKRISPAGDEFPLDGSLLSMYEGKRAKDLLKDVQDLVKTGGNEEGIDTIQKLVDEELLPGLQATHKATQDEVNRKLDAIKSCNTASSTKQNLVKSDEQATDTARKAHAACREEEKNKNSASSGRCKELDDFLNGINSPATLPGGRAREEMVKYVETVSSYFCPGGESKGDEVTKLDDACTAAEAERAKHQAECTAKQTQFESDFCTWRAELTEACNELGSCYAAAVEAWKKHQEATKPLVEQWKVEFKSLHKIKCYVSVFMNDNDAKTVDASQYEKCKATEADDSAMDIDFGTAADKMTCDLSPVATHPGTEAFPTTEYSAFSDLVAAPLACLGAVQASEESTQTVQPETEAPTTTEAPATTTEAPVATTTTKEEEVEVQSSNGVWSMVHYCTHCGNRGSSWQKKDDEQGCGERCAAMGKKRLIFNHKYKNCRCYDMSDCTEDKTVTANSPNCHYHVYGNGL